MVLAESSEDLLDLSLVVGVGEFGVASEGMDLLQGDGVIRMVAVGGTAAGDDEMTGTGLHSGAEDVLGSADIDRVLKLAPFWSTGMDDRRQVNDGVGTRVLHQGDQGGIADIAGDVANMRKSLAGRKIFEVKRGHMKEVRLLGESANNLCA
jgi:hypothetical protein